MADPISIISAVDLCFKYGTKLVHLCSALAHAKDDIAERSLRVNNYWMRAEVQLNVVRDIAHELSEKHRMIQHATIAMLATKLEIATNKIESAIKTHPIGDQGLEVYRWKYALTKEKIDGTIEDLKEWQSLFDPSWYLIMRMTSDRVNFGLTTNRKSSAMDFRDPIPAAQFLRTALNPTGMNAQSVRLTADSLISIDPQEIPFCSAQVGKRPENGQSLILERIEPLPGANVGDIKKDIRDLARRLSGSDAMEFGLLSCKGYIHHRRTDSSQSTPDAFTIIFRMPTQHIEPRSLRACFQDMKHSHSLSDRFKLANELAKAVHSVHLFGFVHKNIRPETILLMGSDESSIGSAFLIGFESFRVASGKTLRKGEASWERCLYQHPDRIGAISSSDYIMQHDIYSLGVCLLELGLWESFLSYDKSSPASHGIDSTPTRAPILGSGRGIYFQEHLLFLAKGELRKRMGTRYSDVVVTCLTCLDANNIDFGDEMDFEDADGIEVGVRYIEKVTMRLNSMCV
ncbi:unnamed protein product [Penicillium nalgiovense]|uniref:Protein kinase domain-containing protein n=1 Tax=Penicillium nalgiovense TaxID=60175 RepID=A0A9W4HPG7_PENNA|nr:unnamed protein product [Penicillium nalgiovense]CAG7960495.1 unnamed protein product [Penicillium nalgiovense]CAG7961903.1 unnamed protein product [Penicillium nalgiovense]CAG7980146.1 unnamed protein product [Penicillium nalgiovense]CAG7994290.1 unnamed protein product [Penicillium nalgiovense]